MSRAKNVDDLSGQFIKGYQLAQLIGKGGFGAVYRAHQQMVDREVAIKIILPKHANDPEFIRRFEAEAHLVARLESLHIVPLYDYWREPDSAFLVMRWLRGGSLKESLAQEKWDMRDVVRLVKQITAALTVAHQNNVIHRDLKPANILLDEERNAYLSDFGIAKVLNVDMQTLTMRPNELVGSPAYVAPEQIVAGKITPQTDIYCFAVLLYEILAGKHPYSGRNTPVAMLNAHLHDSIPTLRISRPDLPDELDLVLQRAMSKKPEERYTDVAAFSHAFRQALGALTRPIELSLLEDPIGETLELSLLEEELTLEPENPYKGLRAFQEADSVHFFGREALTQQLTERLGKASFLAVVGPSGSGKSSAVRAGLIPAVREGKLPNSQDWFVVELVPGAHPLEELEAGLLRVAVNPPATLLDQLRADEHGLLRAIRRVLPPNRVLLLVIDQFEEVFTLGQDPAARAHFLKLLYTAVTEANSPLRVVLTLRADFYDRPLLYPEFGLLMRKSTEVVLPMQAEELEQAITAPARKVGIGVEPRLVAAIIADVQNEPGALPLLQYALTELFERRNGRVLTTETYHHIGGALGALARRAEEIFQNLTPDQQSAARQLFLRLVTLGDGSEDTRRRVDIEELLSLQPAAMQSVIDDFGKYRLLTFDRDPTTRQATVEVAHEAILREWGRLRSWLDASRDDIRQQRRLAAFAHEWQEAERENSFLLRGVHLEEVAAWAEHTELELTPTERAFLADSLHDFALQITQEVARQERETALERRSRRLLQVLAALATLAALVAAGLSFIAFGERSSAERERDNAQAAQLTSDANAATAQAARATSELVSTREAETRATRDANFEVAQSLFALDSAQFEFRSGNPDFGIALALEIAQRPAAPPQQAERFLSEVVTRPGTERLFSGHTAAVWALALSPDGRFLVSSAGGLPNRDTAEEDTPGRDLRLWDVASGQELRRFEGHTATVIGLATVGDELLTASFDGTFRVWQISTGAELRRFEMERGEQLLPLRRSATGVTLPYATNGALALSPDATTFISTSVDGVLRLRDFATGSVLARMGGNTGSSLIALVYSPDSQSALASYDDQRLILWNLSDGTERGRFRVTSGIIDVLAISPDGQSILYNTGENKLIHASLADGSIQHILEGHSARLAAVVFTSDGSMALSAGADGELIVWSLASGLPRFHLSGHRTALSDVVVLPGELRAISGAVDGGLRLWNLGSLVGEVRRVEVPGKAFGVAAHGRLIASGAGSSLHNNDTPAFTGIILWDADTGQEVRRLTGHTASVNSLAFSPDGRLLLSTAEDGSTRLWNTQNGQLLHQWDDHDGVFFRAAFSPDGQSVVSGGFGNLIRRFDTQTGEETQRYTGHTAPVVAVVFSPDGQHLLSGGFDDDVILWDAASGAVLQTLTGHTDWITSVDLSPDGRQALSSSIDDRVMHWDLTNGTLIHRYDDHTAEVMRVIFNRDGRLAFSASLDGRMGMFDLRQQQPVYFFEPDNGYLVDVALGGEPMRLVTTSGHLHLVNTPRTLNLPFMVDWLKNNRYIPALSCEERAQYLVDTECG